MPFFEIVLIVSPASAFHHPQHFPKNTMASTPVDPIVQLGQNSKKKGGVLGNVSSENQAVPRKKPKLNRPSFL